jgi:translation initiation factor IF-1
MHFPIHRAEILKIINENTFEILVADVGLCRASRSLKMRRSLPDLKVRDTVAVELSPYDATRCRITYHRFR